MALKIITKPIDPHLKKFNAYFDDLMKSKVALLDLIVKYMVKKRGKQIRPVFVFLSAEVCGGITERAYIGAAMAELLHNATLVHDDVVDEAAKRRGIASINAAWNNKIAVLVGDYLLSKGLLASIGGSEIDFLGVTSNAVKRMSEGELHQIQKSVELDTSEDKYFDIISDKTAALISACCEIGALSATKDPEKIKRLKDYGESIGIAFQIRDDIFDYLGKASAIGKPTGNDLKEKKITLPLIRALELADKSDGKKILKIIKNGNLEKKEINDILVFVEKHGGIKYAEDKAIEYIKMAKEQLSGFSESPAKDSLIKFADFVIEREK